MDSSADRKKERELPAKHRHVECRLRTINKLYQIRLNRDALGTPYYLPPRQGAPAEGWPPSALLLIFITLQPDWMLSATEEEILRFAQDDSAAAQRITRAYGPSFVNVHYRARLWHLFGRNAN